MLAFPCLLTLFTLAGLAAAQEQPRSTPRNPREQPLTAEDALWTLRGVVGKVVVVPDLDGDGLEDLVVHRGADHEEIGWRAGQEGWLESVSTLDGQTICGLADIDRSFAGDTSWDAGGDADGDGSPDLLVGNPRMEIDRSRVGEIEIISGRTGEVLLFIRGEIAGDGFGSAVAFAGDLDGDGRDDFVTGAPGGNPSVPKLLTGTGAVAARSGADGHKLWSVHGTSERKGFGSFVSAIGDLNSDSVSDVLIQSALWSDEALLLISGRDGRVLDRLSMRGGRAGASGDLNGDGVTDLLFDEEEHFGSVRFLSGSDRSPLFEVPYFDSFGSKGGVTVGLGDMDGDGLGDFAFGEPNYHLRGPGDPGYADGEEANLREMNLRDALDLKSQPWCAFTWESGYSLVYSGKVRDSKFKTRCEVLMGFWGQPGSRDGIARQVERLPDISGDGWPDLLVVGGTRAYAVPGPGAAKSH